jgi:hypothetical protein
MLVNIFDSLFVPQLICRASQVYGRPQVGILEVDALSAILPSSQLIP